MLEFQRIFQKLVGMALNGAFIPQSPVAQSSALQAPTTQPSLPLMPTPEVSISSALASNLHPPFFQLLLSSGNWQQFEEYTHYLFKLLGIQSTYTYVQSEQAGRADGFFKYGNLAVLYEKLNRIEESLDYYRKSAKICIRKGEI